MSINFFVPKWDAPPPPNVVRALFTMRGGGVSHAPFDSLNMSASAGDDIKAVRQNRRLLDAHLPAAAKWLRQAHTAKIVRAEDITDADTETADGIWTSKAKKVCAITVADCAPVLMAAADGLAVAAVHAGWRGLAAGIIENAAAKLRAASSSPIVAWVGPVICARHYPVGDEMRAAFCEEEADCFIRLGGGLCADIAALAKRRLLAAGAKSITIFGECTYQNRHKYFSARRDGNKTGRMAAVIWRQ
ncbi:MAG: peptidoglycan editing factor PgeF [Gammaproteobacteria bacterium]